MKCIKLFLTCAALTTGTIHTAQQLPDPTHYAPGRHDGTTLDGSYLLPTKYFGYSYPKNQPTHSCFRAYGAYGGSFTFFCIPLPNSPTLEQAQEILKKHGFTFPDYKLYAFDYQGRLQQNALKTFANVIPALGFGIFTNQEYKEHNAKIEEAAKKQNKAQQNSGRGPVQHTRLIELTAAAPKVKIEKK